MYGVLIIKVAMKVKLNYPRGIFFDRLLSPGSVAKDIETWVGKPFCVTLPNHYFFIEFRLKSPKIFSFFLSDDFGEIVGL
jgi:hypothetical protein